MKKEYTKDKTSNISFRVNQKELDFLNDGAKANNLTISEFIRELLIKNTIMKKEEKKMLKHEFAQIVEALDNDFTTSYNNEITIRHQGAKESTIYDLTKVEDIEKLYIDTARLGVDSELEDRIVHFLDYFVHENYTLCAAIGGLVYDRICDIEQARDQMNSKHPF